MSERRYIYEVAIRLEPNCPPSIIKRIFLSHEFTVTLVHLYTNDITPIKIDGSNIPKVIDRHAQYLCMYYADTPCDDIVRDFARDDETYIVNSKFEKILVDK